MISSPSPVVVIVVVVIHWKVVVVVVVFIGGARKAKADPGSRAKGYVSLGEFSPRVSTRGLFSGLELFPSAEHLLS